MTDDVREKCSRSRISQWVGLTTYDAKDPETKFPPITRIRPPKAPRMSDHPD
jgi:arylsulfatase